MNIFVDLKAALLTGPAVTAIVGDDSAGTPARVWNSWPRTYQDPCLVMDVDDEGENPFLGTGTGDLVNGEATITCRADTHDGSHALAEAVKDLLGGWSGTFQAILEHTAHAEVPKNDGSTNHWYDHVMSFLLQWNQ
jgi:hypothetical protein